MKKLSPLIRTLPLVLCVAAGYGLARALHPDPPPAPLPPTSPGAVVPAHAPRYVSDDVLVKADQYSGDWLMYARTYSGQRFSPLNQIHRGNVQRLTPRWAHSLGTLGTQQCTPVVHDGVMYVTSFGGRINALKADTGELLWDFDSRLPADLSNFGSDCNRGAALYGDKVIWCNMVGKIFAHHRKTGKVLWQQETENYRHGYVKTLAPLIVKGKVITGTSGGEWGIRGFIDAHDAETGKRVWRTYTIPGPGEPGHDTWPNNDHWKHGGSPTWITGSYDPELNLIYWTTGNGAPWSSEQRPGDNLYSCSVLALNADTGKIQWHFQFVPSDDWDYDCNTVPILAELPQGGETVPVLVAAVKNGYFYVIDRRNGKFLKYAQFADLVTWAKGLDPVTGRPIETGTARPKPGTKEKVTVAPSALGAANWWATAYDPGRKSLFIVANETIMDHVWEPVDFVPGQPYIGVNHNEFSEGLRRAAPRPGRLAAWDLVTMKKKWEAERELEVRWGGPLVTGGDLVFSGTLRGFLQAMDSDTGRRLWQFQTGSGIMAHPVTYSVNGRQYVAIVSGKGGVANPAGLSPDLIKYPINHHNSGMVFAFALP